MIYTRFGTEVKLLAPVDWNTGWVTVLRDGDEKEYHLSDLKADNGLNEIQAASDLLESNETTEIYFCRDCNLPLETLEQETREPQPLTIVTCKNRACSLWSVTLSLSQYNKLTDAEWDTYRQSVANLKKSLEKLGG